ncbi:hypothetical protein E2P81_ATG02544 [Venturia nashicola]|uniref:Uncharacterized protein n=1 Tax=Venturia nashicola TaxID=86259 RepID=A0A4Z1PL86_9PEZI|nr:hypothetical protein E6O75_ATG02605 [Venturia nashicola]TLD36762.1 hypothetical protein E2P81_ATG02544 [Venturia nashicola]
METLQFTRFKRACNNDYDKVLAFLGSRLIQIKLMTNNVFEERPLKDDVLNFLKKEFINPPKSAKENPFPNYWCKMIHFMSLCVNSEHGEPRIISPLPSGRYNKMERWGHFYNLLHAIHYDHNKQDGRDFKDILKIVKIPIKTGPSSRKKKDDVVEPTYPLDPLDTSVRYLENLFRRDATKGEIRRAIMTVKARSKDLRDTFQFTEK